MLQDVISLTILGLSILRSCAGTTSSGGPLRECRICLTTDNQHDIVEPCACTGTVQYAHLECLRSWCVNNLSLKCEICGSVYKDSVVEPLMGTLIEAQDRQVAAQGLSDEQGIRLDVLDAAARQRDSAHPGGAGLPADPATVAETQQRMQAFLEELLQLYVRLSPCTFAVSILSQKHCVPYSTARSPGSAQSQVLHNCRLHQCFTCHVHSRMQ